MQGVLAWVSEHRQWAGLFVFLIAFSESLAAIGLLMPGAVLMFGIGTLVAGGALEFLPTVAWAAAGAIGGDVLSFWLGRHYGERLRTLWPFRSHPALTDRAIGFFLRHGGKSVLLGRFVGPLRPVIPAVAGMLGMPAGRFALVNVASGLAWAPVYLLPGVAVGASLDLAAEIAARLALFLALIIALLWLVVWVLRRSYGWLAPRSDRLIYQTLLWARAHPRMGELPAAVLDPGHGEARGLTLLALLLLGSAAAFAATGHALDAGAHLGALDRFVFESLRQLHTPLADRLMAFVGAMAAPALLAAVIALMALWLALQRRPHALAHWLAATLFAWAMAAALGWATAGVRDVPAAGIHSFPDLGATVVTALAGTLAVLLTRELRLRWHAAIYSLAGLAVAAVSLAGLYLGTAWFSDVLGGVTLGLAWTALVGIAYRRHPSRALSAGGLIGVSLAMLALTAVGSTAGPWQQRLQAIRVPPQVEPLAAAQWWDQAWRYLPARRDDLRGQHTQPLTLQWAGPLPAIRHSLAAHGWRPPPQGGSRYLQWLRPDAPATALPVLPQVNAGRHEALLMVRPENPDKLLALRLWPAPVQVEEHGKAHNLWLGYVSYLQVRHPVGLSVLRTRGPFEAAVQRLARELAAEPRWQVRAVRRTAAAPPSAEQPRVLLVRAAPAASSDRARGASRRAAPGAAPDR